MQSFRHGSTALSFIDESPDAAAGDPVLLIHGFASNHAVNWVNTLWVQTLNRAGRRVIALDNRGHGASSKLYEARDYHTSVMAEDARALLDHLGIARAHVMGYSMGARIAAFLALAHPGRLNTVVLGGLGLHLVDGIGLPQSVADALEAPLLADVTDATGRMFRAFAEATKSDLKALAACIRGSRQVMTRAEAAGLTVPALICVGTRDLIAGDPHALARLIPGARAFDIAGRDHNLAVGDKTYKQAVVNFMAEHS